MLSVQYSSPTESSAVMLTYRTAISASYWRKSRRSATILVLSSAILEDSSSEDSSSFGSQCPSRKYFSLALTTSEAIACSRLVLTSTGRLQASGRSKRPPRCPESAFRNSSRTTESRLLVASQSDASSLALSPSAGSRIGTLVVFAHSPLSMQAHDAALAVELKSREHSPNTIIQTRLTRLLVQRRTFLPPGIL